MSALTVRLTWNQTGDYFDVCAANKNFSLWFVDQCQTHGNRFCADTTQSVDDDINALKKNLTETNEFLEQIGFPQIEFLEDFCSQHNLNTIHKNWISLVRKESRLDQLIYFHSPDLFTKFHDINLLIHKIEKKFRYRLTTDTPWRVSNQFKSITPDTGIYNVCLAYVDWGKSSWDKFINGITSPNDFELSNWENIGSDFYVNLDYPYKFNLPNDYLTYCYRHKIPPTVQTWPIGNLVDYDKDMPNVRRIMNKNIQISNNYLKFSIVP